MRESATSPSGPPRGVYGSGLSAEDWGSLRAALEPFLHAKDPAAVSLPRVPRHLTQHPMMECLRRYRETGDDKDLDRAGRFLVSTDTPFAWYLPLTK
jgi:hypothetical protein